MDFKVLCVVCIICGISIIAGQGINQNQNSETTTRQPRQRVRGQNSGNENTQEPIDDYVPFQGDTEDTFDWLLTRAMMVKEQSNMVISPFSIKLLLILLSEASGTDTATQRELSIILPNIRSPYLARNLYSKIFNSLMQPSDDYVFKMGTKIFIDHNIEPLQRYASIIERYYYTEIERLDFTQLRHSTNTINGWCANITNGEINNLVQQADIERSAMIMLNAIYFRGLWRFPFPSNETVELPFHVSSSRQIKTTYMSQTGRFYFFDSPRFNAKILRLPYKGKKFSMLVVLPNSKEGINELVREMDGTSLRSIEWSMTEVDVRVVFPKFKFEYLSSMKDVLKQLGIQQIFTAQASLPLLARGTPDQLLVSNIIQKAGFQVDEQGSTAYAATQVSLESKFGEIEFSANRPFLFYIQDETTGTFLFAGKITNPAEYEIPQ